MILTVPVTSTGSPCSRSVLPPTLSVTRLRTPAATHAATASGSHKDWRNPRTPRRPATASSQHRGVARAPAADVVPNVHEHDRAFGGGVGVLERLGGERDVALEGQAPLPGEIGEVAGGLAGGGLVAVVDGEERHAHLLDVGVRVPLGDAGGEHAWPSEHLGDAGDDRLHRVFAGVLLDDVDDQRRHLQRLDRADLAVDGPDDQLGALVGALLGVEVGVGAVDDGDGGCCRSASG